MKKRIAVALVTLFGLGACSSADPLAATSQSGSSKDGTIVIGSANFPENELLAEIYAGALRAKRVPVTTKLNIASRETYVPALRNGELDLVPEYTGNFAKYLNSDAEVTDEATSLASLKAALPDTLSALEPARAQNKDAVVVTRQTAEKYGLNSISDLAGHSADMTLGGPPEWQSRATGILGLASVYNVTFKVFRPLDVAGPLSVQSLKNGQVDAVNLFTTDPAIKANGFVVLEDPKNLFGAQNVVPVITKAKATSEVSNALNAVSAELDTDTLASLVAKVVVDKADAKDVAAEFLKEKGLG